MATGCWIMAIARIALLSLSFLISQLGFLRTSIMESYSRWKQVGPIAVALSAFSYLTCVRGNRGPIELCGKMHVTGFAFNSLEKVSERAR